MTAHYSSGVLETVFNRPLRAMGMVLVCAIVAAGCSSSPEVVSANVSEPGTSSTAPVDDAGATAQPETSTAEAATPTSVAPAETTPSTALAVEPSTTTTTSITTTTTTTIAAPSSALECAAALPLEVRIGQLLFPLITQDEFPVANDLVAQGHMGGVVVLGRPDATIRDDIAALQGESLLGPLIVAVDEEGGRVQRVDHLVGEQPSARSVAATDDPATARQRASDHAVALGELGFTMNLAPVADLDTGVFVGDRAYSSDPEVVSEYALTVAEGILDGGLTPVIKHFPGHGAGLDSHTGLPTIPAVDELRGQDLVPFERAIERGGLPIMIGHLVVPGLTGERPATLSSAAVDGLLRGELGFDGLVMTDALNMAAIAATTTNAQAAELSIDAGVDLIMLGSLNAVEGTVAHLSDAVANGRLSEDQINSSLLRVLDERQIEICGFPQDFLPAIGCETDSPACR